MSSATGPAGGGGLLTITGTNFTDGSLTAIAPSVGQVSNLSETLDITVQTPSGMSAVSPADQFTITPAGALPTVAALSVTNGSTAGGNVITITGTNFTDVSGVSFGIVAATSYTVTSPTSLTVTTPAVAVGTVDVTVTTTPPGAPRQSSTSATSNADRFSFQLPVPVVTRLDVTTGSTLGGDVVTISGSNFTNATAVSFGGIAATWRRAGGQ